MAFKILTASRCNALLMLALLGLGACASGPRYRSLSAHECMQRVMYFESNRSSPEGMVAVGTVVMNRLNSGKYPKTVCGVIGQKNQFAPGVLTRKMGAGKDLASAMATKVLKGTRHGYVGRAMFFHTAGMTFPYTNMHYLVEAGGNVFYEKRKNARNLGDPPFRNSSSYPGSSSSSAAVAPAAAAPASRPVVVSRMATRSVETVNTGTSNVIKTRAAPDIEAPGGLKPIPIRRVQASSGGSLDAMSIDDLIAINGG